MPRYLTVTCRLPACAEDQLAAALETWPVLGCQVEDLAGGLGVTVYLAASRRDVVPEVVDGLRGLGGTFIASAPFAEQDWLSEYRKRVAPTAVGRLFWIDPHPSTPTPAPAGRLRLAVEPRQAFGTGSHESTRLVLLLLEDDPPHDERVLDVGTGSGILALAARVLGARLVVAFDLDLDAVFVARETVASQPSPMPVALYCGTVHALHVGAPFDVVLVNLLPAQALDVIAAVRALLAPGARLLLSGLLADQRAALEAELGRYGLAVVKSRELGEWTGLVCRRRAT